MIADDADLVALIDGELSEPLRSDLVARLGRDPALRARYEALRATSAPVHAALDFALADAPRDRLRAFLPADAAAGPREAPAARGRERPALGALVAGIVIGAVAASALLWFAVSGVGHDGGWRSAVVRYMDLYTTETFDFPAPDLAARARALAAVGARVGAALTPAAVAAAGLDFRAAFSLGYEGTPLAEIAYVEATGEPVLLCIFRDGGADAPVRVERRESYALAAWTRAGREFLVIGRLPEARAAELARSLAARL